ncbi:MAG: transglutaminase domain-containing protein [Candidatus Omnitrophica bacterium]|nr:transglutaminase domain-containing protein [Candidatus Omnitrophota bacterium]
MSDKNYIKKIIPVIIVVFWLVMTGMLINRELIAKNRISAYRPFLSADTLFSDQWLGIYFNNSPMGFVHTTLEPYVIDKGVPGYLISNRTYLEFLVLNKRNKVWFNADTVLDSGYKLHNFKFELNSGPHTMSVKGNVQRDNMLTLEIDSQGTRSTKKVVLAQKEGVMFAGIMSPFNSFGELKVGAKYHVSMLNPFSLELEPLDIEVSAKEILGYQGNDIEVFLVKSIYRGMEQKSWVNAQGEILKEETAMGWVLLKEDDTVADKIYRNIAKTDLELMALVSVASNIILPENSLSYLKIAIFNTGTGFDLENQRQKVIEADDAQDKKIIEIKKDIVLPAGLLALPIEEKGEFRLAEDFIQSDEKIIKEQARKIIKDETDGFSAAKLINKWVFKNINKVPVVSIPSALDVLKTREGDCNEHTALFCALARAAGIPAKVNVGLAYTGGRFFYHSWPSVYVGQWIDMDPTFGQDIADAGHIKLIEGDLNRQLDIIKVLGKIKLEVIDYK